MKNRKSCLIGLLLPLISLCAPARAAAQHIHVIAGTPTPAAGQKLLFVNGEGYATNSGYVINLDLKTTGPSRGLYDGGPTFTAAAIDELNGGPEPGHAAPGARIAARVVSVDGPAGGSFSFWDSPNCEDNAGEVTFSLPAGTAHATNAFLLSQNNGEPGADPYGHCHGRRYTADLPGLYTVGFQLVDVSTNGPGGGPLHGSSDITYFHFQAGLAIDRMTRDGAGLTAWFGTKNFGAYTLESSGALDDSEPWETVAGPVTGDNHLQSLTVPDPVGGPRFYRLRWETQ